MLTDKRKKELDTLAIWASCAGDRHYFNMEQGVFDKYMTGREDYETYKPYTLQREMGFDKFKADMAEKIAAINSAEELHYMVADHNYDSGRWLLEQVVTHPACDLITAKMIYWLSSPCYYYTEFGSPSKCPEDNINIGYAKLIAVLETKANGEGFQTGMKLDNEIVFEQPPGLDYDTPPYCQIPEVFRACVVKDT